MKPCKTEFATKSCSRALSISSNGGLQEPLPKFEKWYGSFRFCIFPVCNHHRNPAVDFEKFFKFALWWWWLKIDQDSWKPTGKPCPAKFIWQTPIFPLFEIPLFLDKSVFVLLASRWLHKSALAHFLWPRQVNEPVTSDSRALSNRMTCQIYCQLLWLS